MVARRGPSLRAQLLGKLLRECRERTDVTTAEAGEYIQRSQATMSRIESGIVPARSPDVMALLNLYSVDDQSFRDALDRLSRDVFRKGWWDGNSEYLADWFIDFAWLEERASAIRLYDAILVPGLLQTREYAEAAIRAGDVAESEEAIQQGVDFRMRRQQVLESHEPAEVSTLIDESVLRRANGSSAILAGQLRHLAELAQRPNIAIRVIPQDAPVLASLSGTFTIFEALEPYTAIAYSETLAGGVYVEDERVDRFVRTYDELSKIAYDAERSTELIERSAADLE
jgi:hypothetical protein